MNMLCSFFVMFLRMLSSVEKEGRSLYLYSMLVEREATPSGMAASRFKYNT